MPKNVLDPYQTITNGSMTGTAAINSSPTNIRNIDNVSIQVTWTGTAVGVFKVQVANTPVIPIGQIGGVPASGDWADLPLYLNGVTYNPAAAGTAGTIILDLNQVAEPWIRTVYTNSSSTGTLQAYISGKGV